MADGSALLDGLAPFRAHPFERSRNQTLGVTAVLRVRRETSELAHSLPPLLRAVDEVIVIDNRSGSDAAETGATDQAHAIAAGLGLSHRLRVLAYPFELSPPGPAHLDTPPGAVHSLVHFHNWAFSHVRTTFALRWDASLALTPAGESLLAAFTWQVGRHHVTLRVPRHPLYVESDQVAYLDLAWPNLEHRGHPIAPGYSYVKGFERAILRFPEHTRVYTLPVGTCLLLRDLGDAHRAAPAGGWGTPSSPEARRERYEADTVRAILAGRWRERTALHRLETPPGTHVVAHAASFWAAP